MGFSIFMDVKTAGRTVELFEVFAKSKRPLTMSEVARAMNVPQSSCYNLMRALESRGFLYPVGGNKRVYPTRKLSDLAQAIIGYDPVTIRMEPVMQEICDATAETVILGTLLGKKIVYLAVTEGSQTIRYISRPGELKPVHASAIGKAMLMSLDLAARVALVGKLSLEKFTDRTIDSPAHLLAEISLSETRGFAQTVGENVVDVMAVACPIELDSATYAVAVAGPVGRLQPKATEIAGRLKEILAKMA